MDLINAISKVRFGSAKPQRVQLHKDETLSIELLCLEPGQKIKVSSGQWRYYVIVGTATFSANGQSAELPTGQLAVTARDESHTIASLGDRRLVCLAIGES